jgi:hypothetical protein
MKIIDAFVPCHPLKLVRCRKRFRSPPHFLFEDVYAIEVVQHEDGADSRKYGAVILNDGHFIGTASHGLPLDTIGDEFVASRVVRTDDPHAIEIAKRILARDAEKWDALQEQQIQAELNEYIQPRADEIARRATKAFNRRYGADASHSVPSSTKVFAAHYRIYVVVENADGVLAAYLVTPQSRGGFRLDWIDPDDAPSPPSEAATTCLANS